MLLPEKISIKLQILEQLLNDFDVDDSQSVRSSSSQESAFVDQMQKLRVSQGSTKFEEEEEEIEESKEFWKVLKESDLEVFNKLDENLLMYQERDCLENALKYLKTSIDDFPPDYFLQSPPNIIGTLMDIVWKVSQNDAIEIVRIMRFILNGLKDRWIEAENLCVNYFPVKKHINKILQIFTDFFEHFHDEEKLAYQQEILNEIFLILFDLADFVKETQEVCEIYLNELLNMLGKVAKNFRRSNNCRVNYLVCIYLINIFISSMDTTNISKFCVNNVWEYELDVALLDFPLKSLHKKIYNLIMKNRLEVIEEDKDLEMLLKIDTFWKPVVEIFQNHSKISDKEIIFLGLQAIDSLYIHKNPEMVSIIINAMNKCSSHFHTNQKLKEAAEDLFLRLISSDILEIRKRTYSLARENVQRKLSEECNDPRLKNFDVCAVLGIPFSLEIFTEILCFGNTSEDEEIKKNVRLIIFTILRSKIIFPNHWNAILSTIKPILVMLPSLFFKESKLGFLAFDIFNQNSGFTKDELNNFFARFLFASHQNAREFAKRKLLENLNEYAQDFIEIVPDNFCIISKDFKTDLQVPDHQIGYDPEAYQTTAQLLKSITSLNDPDVLQSILLQLSVLMNSKKLCIKAHDDNLWVYFMASPDMNFPNHAIIRKLTINILFKWATCIPSFRIYLSNESKILAFLINTLIYYHDENQIKKQASSLLFLLLFSDFVVVNDKITSLPNIINTLECPFRFQGHWKESPFNKISQLECLYETMEMNDVNDSDIKQLTLKYFRFSFARAWFKEPIDGKRRNYYKNCENALKIPEKLMLNENDLKSFNEISFDRVVNKFCKDLENSTTLEQILKVKNEMICLVMMPEVKVDEFASLLNDQMRKYHLKSRQFYHLIELCEAILPLISDDGVMGMMKGETIFMKLLNDIDEENYEILRLFNAIVKMCTARNQLANKIVKMFNDEHKIQFSSVIVEKLVDKIQLYIRMKAFNDIELLSTFKITLATLRNVLNNFTIVLDESFLNATFGSLLNATKYFLPSSFAQLKSNKISNSHLVDQMFAIIERICSLSIKMNLKPEDYNTIFLWLTDEKKMNKALVWKIVAQLTKNNLHFIEFSKGFDSALGFPFYEVLIKCINNHELQILERNAQALVLGNLLDFISDSSQNQLKMILDNKKHEEIKSDMAKFFICQKTNSIDAISFIVKKMIINEMPQVASLVKEKKIIERILKSGVQNLDVIVACYKFKPLENHVANSIRAMSDGDFSALISQLINPLNRNSKVLEANERKINKNVLDIILILLQSPKGYEKIHENIFKNSNILNDFVMIIACGLQNTIHFAEIMFHLEVLHAFLNCNKTHELFINQEFTHLKSEYLLKLSSEKSQKIVHVNYKHVQYAVDLFMLHALGLFNVIDNLKFNNDSK